MSKTIVNGLIELATLMRGRPIQDVIAVIENRDIEDDVETEELDTDTEGDECD